MNLFEIEIGRSYKCDRPDGQYFKVGTESDPGDPVATPELTWLAPSHVHPL